MRIICSMLNNGTVEMCHSGTVPGGKLRWLNKKRYAFVIRIFNNFARRCDTAYADFGSGAQCRLSRRVHRHGVYQNSDKTIIVVRSAIGSRILSRRL